MSITNRISIVINDDALAKIQEGQKMILDNLPQLISLSPEERHALPKMGNKTVAFVNKALEYGKQNPKVLPAFLDMEEFAKDAEAVNILFKVIAPLTKLQEELDDTILLAGSEAYAAALVVYKALKAANGAGQTGLKNICEDLSARFIGSAAKAASPDVK